tara:strand:+ start:81769 stop:82080 length:312 start_codon:yes stop_codon:yes gene_type:complete
MLIILTVSALPSKAIPDIGFQHTDKIAHFLVYSLLGFIAVKSFSPHKLVGLICIICFGMIFGAFDEWWQSFISDRCTSLADFFADTAGMLIGSILFYKPSHRL